MADKKLNEVSQLTDFDYALVVKGNDVAKVTKQQLATILGELMNNLKLFPFTDRGKISDANDAKLAGMYWTDNLASNIPVADWMLLWVFTSDIYIIQFIYPLNERKLHIRNSNDKGKNWYDWKQIQTT